ncbi:MAG: hypothetical protein Ct9H300mP21_10450 [Pseudomonadota bacterium]|nr:MAG: hypothetical protein Ct9H300mP21_10450 [Pseudomonadota bacterium]
MGGLLSPEDKSQFYQNGAKKKGPAAMVGDGLNDGPVLASAGIGIAVGGPTDLARRPLIWFYLKEDSNSSLGYKFPRNVRKTIITNIMWAFGYNWCNRLAYPGLLQPILAALLMAGSSLLVV